MKIYIIKAPQGVYEDYCEPIVKVFADKGKAEEYVKIENAKLPLKQADKSERVGYDTQKPKSLLYPIIDSSCPKDGTFADFFCGSGTSLVVAKELGIKNIIGVDINSTAIEISNKRLNKE